jgi:hypothetical protein
MRIQDGDVSADLGRTAMDRHAVNAAGQLLMSAIWFEHRVRRFSTRLSPLPSQRASSVMSCSVAHDTHRGLLDRDSRGN